MKYVLALIVIVVGVLSQASAQQSVLPGHAPGASEHVVAPMGMASRIRFANDDTSLTLNLNMNLRVSASMSTDEREAALEKAQHVMLNMFSHECELIRTELASDCKVTQMNVAASMNQVGPMSEVGYINAGVQGSFSLMPTSTATPQQP